ncbi:MAG: hypothetical protein A2087_14670 [Spirochaetes bacterium GWD1_61_31]|nr:MAG: hypothetical protein A2Y37_09340 [Spirochaetes bacterium GWB1_60_80]OHD31621.1 MAG: hypothetical protein A2004_09555 [Spirochaetes bacterium GWC1_61_12]OHD35019.1 MAG: hypothetical protein A2087_14670 [Spirochaetes bacterium GWD1_61_31]OHD44033.1 MAG: hypothetical protein A2Y35_01710 [Spirochaetes bacterium GWE1_60_18]OHD59068.1 MAG: hypothetical protein A2Y32_02430 [Spirochaetes bacterium GWF1_60_12]HAP42599.1 hypothetical protein [Spirochaetaceae bacterium]
MNFEGFLLGLSTGSYCVMTCLPLALPSILAEPAGHRANAARVGLFMLGRLLAYLAVGLLLGGLGTYAAGFLDPLHARRLQIASWLLSGAVLSLGGLLYHFPRLKLCQLTARWWRPGRGLFLLGLAAGLSICPPFVAAAARLFGAGLVAPSLAGGADGAATAGGPLAGVWYFFSFYLGTSVWLIPLFAGGWLASPRLANLRSGLKPVARGAMLLLGVYFLFFEGLLKILTGGWS